MDSNETNKGLGYDGNDYEYYHQITENQNQGYDSEISPFDAPVIPEIKPEEKEKYDYERSQALGIAIDTEAKDSERRRVKSIMSSTRSNFGENEKTNTPQSSVEVGSKEYQESSNVSNYYSEKENDGFNDLLTQINKIDWYAVIEKQRVKEKEVIDEKGTLQKVKEVAWKIAPYVVGGAIFISSIIGGKVVADRIEQSKYHTPQPDKATEQFEEELQQDGLNFEERMQLIKDQQQQNIEMNGNEHVVGYVDEASQGGRSL